MAEVTSPCNARDGLSLVLNSAEQHDLQTLDTLVCPRVRTVARHDNTVSNIYWILYDERDTRTVAITNRVCRTGLIGDRLEPDSGPAATAPWSGSHGHDGDHARASSRHPYDAHRAPVGGLLMARVCRNCGVRSDM